MPNDAVEALTQVLTEGFQPKKLDELYDFMKLLGVVIGYHALLEAAISGTEKERVPAARALVNLKEDPIDIVERLRRSPFADLTIAQLRYVVEQLKLGETDISTLIEQARQEPADGHIQQTL